MDSQLLFLCPSYVQRQADSILFPFWHALLFYLQHEFQDEGLAPHHFKPDRIPREWDQTLRWIYYFLSPNPAVLWEAEKITDKEVSLTFLQLSWNGREGNNEQGKRPGDHIKSFASLEKPKSKSHVWNFHKSSLLWKRWWPSATILNSPEMVWS